MAISKILHMKDTGSSFHGKHLKSSLEYVMNPEKTQDGRLIGGVNCQPEYAFEQMKATKRKFNKIDKRQGYHLVISFQEGEITPDTAFELAGKFVQEFIGKEYEAVYVVHDNTDHVHSHIIFNSVSFLDGKKFRYEKGDWARIIQPITNRLCEEYGLSVLEIEEEVKDGRKKSSEYYKEWNEIRDGAYVWSDMVKRDLDACILQVDTFESFLELLQEKGYEIKQGKYLAVKAPGMKKFRRCHQLGEEYSKEAIMERIPKEDLKYYQSKNQEEAKIVFCKVKRYKRAKLSGLQKKYYARLYRIGKLKKKPYSQAWKYRDEIRKMQQLQRQYLYLANHNIHSILDLVSVVDGLTTAKKSITSDKSKVYKTREKFKPLFAITDKMEEIKHAEVAFQSGDEFFLEEHKQWEVYLQELKNVGYSYEEVMQLKNHFKEEIAQAASKEKQIRAELKMGENILKDLTTMNESNVSREEEIIQEERKEREKSKKQPPR